MISYLRGKIDRIALLVALALLWLSLQVSSIYRSGSIDSESQISIFLTYVNTAVNLRQHVYSPDPAYL